MYFRDFGLPKTWLDQCLRKSHFRASVEKQHGKCAQRLFKFEGQPLDPIY